MGFSDTRAKKALLINKYALPSKLLCIHVHAHNIPKMNSCLLFVKLQMFKVIVVYPMLRQVVLCGQTAFFTQKRKNSMATCDLLYKMKIWWRIYFGGLANYENSPN